MAESDKTQSNRGICKHCQLGQKRAVHCFDILISFVFRLMALNTLHVA